MSEDSENADELVRGADDADTDYVLSPKPARKRKSTAGSRKIQHTWTDDQISRLIACVEQHKELWDFGTADERLIRQKGWRKVSIELGIDGVDGNEAKVKWCSLRTTYMVNVAKVKNKQIADWKSVTWKFFPAMTFLGTTHFVRENSTAKAKPVTMNSASDISDPLQVSTYIAQRLSNAYTYDERIKLLTNQAAITPSTEFVLSKRRRLLGLKTPTPPRSPTPSACSAVEITTPINKTTASQSPDTNSTFCDNLLAELRTLPESRARTLRFKILRLMMDFIERCEEPAQLSPNPVSVKSEDVDFLGAL